MLSIAQAGQQFYYLNWTPTTSKPVINGYGYKTYEKSDIASFDFYKSLFGDLIEKFKIISPRIYYTLDLNSLYLSESQLPEVDKFEPFQKWLNSTNYDSSFSKRFEIFYYPFDKKIKKSLNIHISTSIKNAILQSTKYYKAELRFLSSGIFSAESCIRALYKSDELSNYIVWRLGQYNQNDMIWIKNNKLICLIKFKNLNSNFKLDNYFGCSKSTDKILKEMEKCSNNNFSKFNLNCKTFVYCNKNQNKDLQRIINSNPSQFLPIDINRKLRIKQKKDSFIFAETGVAFRGFDV